MKINEIVSEGRNRAPMRAMHKQMLPDLVQYDKLDNNNHPYLAYRFGIALAGAPRADMDQRGPIGSAFAIVDYTEADTEIRSAAEKIMGIKPDRRTGTGSKELPTTQKNSPVSKPKRNKYGV